MKTVLAKIDKAVWSAVPPVQVPLCGLVSLEKITKIFLYSIFTFYTISALCQLGFVVFFYVVSPAPEYLHQVRLTLEAKQETSDDSEEVTHLAKRRKLIDNLIGVHFSIPFILVVTLIKGIIGFAAWKCVKAITTGIIPKMKRYFCLLACLRVALLTYQLGASDWQFLTSTPIFLALKIIIIFVTIIGLVITYFHIASSIKNLREIGPNCGAPPPYNSSNIQLGCVNTDIQFNRI